LNNKTQNELDQWSSASVPADLLQVSRLDIAERNLRQVRAKRKLYHSDEDDDDNIEKEEMAAERRRQTLLLIDGGPALERDLSHEKMNFLGQFGLTTDSVAGGQSTRPFRQLNY